MHQTLPKGRRKPGSNPALTHTNTHTQFLLYFSLPLPPTPSPLPPPPPAQTHGGTSRRSETFQNSTQVKEPREIIKGPTQARDEYQPFATTGKRESRVKARLRPRSVHDKSLVGKFKKKKVANKKKIKWKSMNIFFLVFLISQISQHYIYHM